MREFRIGAVLLLFFVGVWSDAPVWAADPGKPAQVEPYPTIDKQTQAELELAVRVNTILYEVDKTAEKKEGEGKPYTDAEWETQIRQTFDKVLSEYEKLGLDKQKKSWMQKTLAAISWRKIVDYYHGIRRTMISQARTHGGLFIFSYVVGTVMGYALPAAFYYLDQPVLASISWFWPWRETLFGGGFVIKKKLLEKELIKLYGGREQYEKVKHGYEHAREELFIRGKGDIIMPLLKKGDERPTEAAVISDYYLHERWLERLGFSRKRLTYQSLQRFVKDNKVEDGFSKSLDVDTSIDPKIKAMMLMQHIATSGNLPLMEKLKGQYADSFVELLESPYHEAVRKWAVSFASAKNLPDFVDRLEKIPHGVPVRALARVWNEAIIPVVGENLRYDIYILESIRLQDAFRKVLIEAEKNPNAVWGPEWTARMHEYLKTFTSFRNCSLFYKEVAAAKVAGG